MSTTQHEPVLLKEVIEALDVKKGKKYIDATLGAGGYTKAILEAGGEVLGIDTDESMISIAKENISKACRYAIKEKKIKMINGNFRNIKKIAQENNFMNADGIVFDLGVSNVHFSSDVRGFSFRNPEAELDMRLDPKSQSLKASDLLNVLREDQLKELFGKSLAEKIIEYRNTSRKFSKVGDFLSLFPEKQSGKIHPATKAFMMLRIAVNSELENLKEALPQAYEILKPGGKLVVVSFHSLEDAIVKNFMNSKEFMRPSTEEIARNPKSRSAILRIYAKN